MKLCCFAMRTYDTPPKSKPLHTRVIEKKKSESKGRHWCPFPLGVGPLLTLSWGYMAVFLPP